jgi:GNAT superfamily N-acetyltransferase
MGRTTVRPARPDEASAIQRLGRASWHAAYDDILGAETVDRTVDDWWATARIESAVVEEERTFLVAESDGTLVGVADAGPFPEGAGTWGLGRLYVHPAHWGEGVGTELVEAVRARLPRAAERLRLRVLAANDVGVSFYEGYGFERVGRVIGETDGEPHEEYVYELEL